MDYFHHGEGGHSSNTEHFGAPRAYSDDNSSAAPSAAAGEMLRVSETNFLNEDGGLGGYYYGEGSAAATAEQQQQQQDGETAGFFDAPVSTGGTGACGGPLFGTGGDFEGGGFLLQSFGGGGYGASQSNVERLQQQNTFSPVKIGAVMRAFEADPTVHEIALAPPPAAPLYILRVVGRLSRIEDASGAAAAAGDTATAADCAWDFSMGGRISFELEDGSGVLDCDWHLGDDITPYKQRSLESTMQLNRYVRVYGQLSLLGKSLPILRVHAVRPVTSAAELLFHEIDCCSAFLRLKFAGQHLPDPLEETSPQQQQQKQRPNQQPYASAEIQYQSIEAPLQPQGASVQAFNASPQQPAPLEDGGKWPFEEPPQNHMRQRQLH